MENPRIVSLRIFAGLTLGPKTIPPLMTLSIPKEVETEVEWCGDGELRSVGCLRVCEGKESTWPNIQ